MKNLILAAVLFAVPAVAAPFNYIGDARLAAAGLKTVQCQVDPNTGAYSVQYTLTNAYEQMYFVDGQEQWRVVLFPEYTNVDPNTGVVSPNCAEPSKTVATK